MNRRIALFGLVGALLLAGIWYMTAYRGQSALLADVHTQTASVQGDTANQLATVEELRQAKSALDEHTDRILQLTEAVPQRAELADFLATVNALAAKHHVTIDSISQTPPVKAAAPPPPAPLKPKPGESPSTTVPAPVVAPPVDASTMSVALSAQGSYENVMAFMHGLDTLPRLVVIDSVSFTPGSAAAVDPVATQSSGSSTTSTQPSSTMALALNVRVFTNQSSLEASA